MNEQDRCLQITTGECTGCKVLEIVSKKTGSDREKTINRLCPEGTNVRLKGTDVQLKRRERPVYFVK